MLPLHARSPRSLQRIALIKIVITIHTRFSARHYAQLAENRHYRRANDRETVADARACKPYASQWQLMNFEAPQASISH